jgi:hypothetical protein
MVVPKKAHLVKPKAARLRVLESLEIAKPPKADREGGWR